MFNWKDYLLFSEKLLDIEDTNPNSNPNDENKDSQNSDVKEAIYRTICSRSYYSIFKEIEDFLKKITYLTILNENIKEATTN